MKRPRVYIASKMSGIPAFNFPAFDRMRIELTSKGFDVVSPADIDREHGFDGTEWLIAHPDWDWNVIPDHCDYEEIMKRDFEALKTCDAIVMFGEYSDSKGALRERAYAFDHKIPVFYECDDDFPFLMQGRLCPQEVTSGEVRVTDPTTGGQKGSKLARYDLIPAGPLHLLAEHYGRGSQKYADHNWAKGYKWSLTFAACQRHLWQFWNGEDIDDETKSQHVIAAMWHCCTMSYFLTNGVGTDDRMVKPNDRTTL